MKKIRKYLRVWQVLINNTFLVNTNRKFGFSIFLIGKLLRFALYFSFIFYALSGKQQMAGYNSDQVLFFFLTFTLIDALAQLLFRNVYTFRNLVVSGSFDLFLSKPFSPLFRVLLGGVDLIDAATIPLFLFFLVRQALKLQPSLAAVIMYLIMIVSSLIIAAAFHIFVVALGIITLQIDHLIMIFRDVESMARFPIEIYHEPLRSVLTFVIPVGLMISLPAKVFLGLASWQLVVFSNVFSIFFLIISLRFWKFALKRYTSASS